MTEENEETKNLAEIKKKLKLFYATKVEICLKILKCFPMAPELERLSSYSSNSRIVFESLVCKQLLMCQFELVFCSIELLKDPKWCKERLNCILQLMESFNGTIQSAETNRRDSSKCKISLADICDTFVLSSGFVASVTIAMNNGVEYINDWVNAQWSLTVGVVLSIVSKTSLLCHAISEHLLSCERDWYINTVSMKNDPQLADFVDMLWGRVWQETGRRLVPKILGMGIRMKDKSIEMLHMLIKDIGCKFSAVWQCLMYVLDSVTTRNQLNKCCSDLCKKTLELSSSTKLSVETVHSHILENIRYYRKGLFLIKGKVGTLTLSESNNGDISIQAVIATEANRMLMTCPLVHAVHCTLWTPQRIIVHHLQQSLSCDDLTGTLHLLFEVDSDVIRGERRAAIKECGEAVTPALYLPPAAPQYWIVKRNMDGYTNLHESMRQCELMSDGLWEAFMFQWRSKCRLLLDTVFPSLKVLKKLGKIKDPLTPSAYIVPIKEQLVLPLLSACASLSPTAQESCVFLTFSILLLQFWNTLQQQQPARMSDAVYKILLKDCQYLLSLMTSDTNSLYPDCREVMRHLPIYESVEKRLRELAHEAGGSTGLLEDCGSIVQEVQGRLQMFAPLKSFLDELAWF